MSQMIKVFNEISQSSLGLVFPTYYEGDGTKKEMEGFIEGLKYIYQIPNIKILINFQNYPDDLITYFVEKLQSSVPTTWSIKYRISHYEKVSMSVIRNDCILLDTSCDYYVFVDDDLHFKDRTFDNYNDILNFMDNDEKLGMVMSGSFLGGSHYKGILKYDVTKFWWTNRGLFVRNFKKLGPSPIFSEYSLNTISGLEESYLALDTLCEGYKLATYFNNNASHKGTTITKTADQIHNLLKIIDSLKIYMKSRFNKDMDINLENFYQKLRECQVIAENYGKGLVI